MKSFKITLAFCLLLGVGYVLLLWVFAQVAAPHKGCADVITLNGKVVGAAHVGQQFTQAIYFWGRPSHAGGGYDAANSSGSNKGPTSEEYLAVVAARVDTFLMHHPYLDRQDVPAEMVTASASGLDPHITLACAYVQVKRVAEARGMDEAVVKAIVDESVEAPLLGLFGTAKVNVLKLNVALEGTTTSKITDSFSLPIFAQAIHNPHKEDAHGVVSIALKPSHKS